MKTYRHKIIPLTIGVLLIIPTSIQAQGSCNKVQYQQVMADINAYEWPPEEANDGDDVQKSKKINRTFKVSASDKLEVENKFGRVHINTWDKNEITVDIEIIARAGNEAKAQQILDRITVDIAEDKSKNLIRLKTAFEEGRFVSNNGGNKGYEVNYTISMPRKNSLKAKNSYGDMYVANLTGTTELSASYGSLKTDRLEGESAINLAYGSGDVDYMKKGRLDISYSNLTLDNSGTIDLKNSYSEVDIGSAEAVEVDSRYGSVDIGSVGSLQGSSGYTRFQVDALKDKLDMRVQYGGGFAINNVSSKFKSINLRGEYSSFDIEFEKNTGFEFDIDLQYAGLKVDKEEVQFKVLEKRNTSATYKGTFGKPSGGATLRIVSSYGDVRLDKK